MSDETAITKTVPALTPAPPAEAISPLKGAEWMTELATFDWRNIKPHQMALLLTKKRFPAEGGGYIQLSLFDSLAISMRCYTLGLDPNSSEVWIDAVKLLVNPTVEGLKKQARNQGIVYEITSYEYKEREWPARLPKLPGIPKDRGCLITLTEKGKATPIVQTAWLSEWGCRWGRDANKAIASVKWQSYQWEERTDHMLYKRANGLALEELLGVGGSGLPSELQLETTPALDAPAAAPAQSETPALTHT